MTAAAERLLRRYFPKLTPLAKRLIAKHEAESDKTPSTRSEAHEIPALDLAETRRREPKTRLPDLWRPIQ